MELPGLTENIAERSYTRKVYNLDNGQKRYLFHIAHKHYKDGDIFRNIDTTLKTKLLGGWQNDKASYHCQIPEYSDDWFEFYNAYEGANHTIKAKPVCNHVKGEYFKGEDGNGVLYKDAFGKGIDLKVYAYWAGLKKVIIINKKPKDTSKDLTFDFEIKLPQGKDKVKDKQGNVWDKHSTLNFKDKKLLIGEDGKESYFRNASVWDSGGVNGINRAVDIQLYNQGTKIYLRKTIEAETLQNAVYPIYTDHPTTYESGTGDGYCWYKSQIGSSWDVAHDAADSGFVASDSLYVLSNSDISSKGGFSRAFVPIDTSGIDDGATISAATLYLWAWAAYNQDNDGDDWINIVQATAPATATTALVTGDYDLCGSIDNPTEGSTRRDITTDITVNAFNSFALNSTGIGWIDKTGTTKFGVREGHDCIDSPMSVNTLNYVLFRSEETDAKEPYLDVTTGGGPSSTLVSQVTVRKLTYSNLVSRINVEYAVGASSLISRVVIYKTGTSSFISRVIVLNSNVLGLVSRVLVLNADLVSLVSRVVVSRSSVSNLVCKVTVSAAVSGYSNVVARVTVSKAVSFLLVSQVTILKESLNSLVSRVGVRKQDTQLLVSKLTVRKVSIGSLVSRVSVIFASDTKDLSCGVIVRCLSSNNLVSRLSVRKLTTRDLVFRVIVRKENSVSLVSQIEVLKSVVFSLLCKIEVYNPSGATRNLVSRVNVLKSALGNLVSRVNVLKGSFGDLVNRVTVCKASSVSLVSRVLVRKAVAVIWECRVTVRGKSSKALVGRVYICPDVDNSFSVNSVVRVSASAISTVNDDVSLYSVVKWSE